VDVGKPEAFKQEIFDPHEDARIRRR